MSSTLSFSLGSVVTIIGTLVVSNLLYRFLSFIWLYFLRPSSVGQYLHGDVPYAVVTGASDGIGKEVARELYNRGFNLIVHGRNEEKLRKVIDDIRAGGPRDIKYFLASADRPDIDFDEIAERFKDLNITLLVNNVGDGGSRTKRIDDYPQKQIIGDVHVNCLFSFNLTRSLLPKLRSAAGPALVVFVGSISADIHAPRLYNYSPCKSFLFQLTRCLNTDEYYWTPTNVSFSYFVVGEVVSNSMRLSPNIFRPLPERFAKHFVEAMGCGWERVTPYWLHAVQQYVVSLLGDRFVGRFAAGRIKELLAHDLKWKAAD